MVRVAAVVPSYGHDPHLDEVVRALLAQHRPPDAVVVFHTGHGDPRDRLAPDPRLAVHHQDARLLPGGARNAGAAAAGGADWLAFVDSDVIVPPDWLGAQLAEARPGQATTSALVPAEGTGWWARCLWWVEFGSIHPYLPPRRNDGGASAALVVARADFERLEGFDAGMTASEDSDFFERFAAAGGTLLFRPRPAAAHRFREGAGHALSRARTLGRHSARHRRRNPHRPGAAAVRRPVLSLGLWLARLGLMTRRVAVHPGAPRGDFLRHLPGILACLLAWNAGFSAEAFRRRPLSGRGH